MVGRRTKRFIVMLNLYLFKDILFQQYDVLRAHGQLLAALATSCSHKIVLNAGDAVGVDAWLTVFFC